MWKSRGAAQTDSPGARPPLVLQSLVSIVIPTLNEAENLPALVSEIDAAMTGLSYEILIVDDNSADNTAGVCASLAQTYPVQLVVRQEPAGGLSGAVLEGLQIAHGDTFVVMDADLQHPPARIHSLLEALDNGADFAVGSRYAAGGSVGKRWSVFRWLNSRVATLLAWPISGNIHDPMSGFFALRRQTFALARRPAPLGYKIGLELMCKCRVRTVDEVPIQFGDRKRGRSKLTLTQQFKYLEHLSRLYDFCFPRSSPIVKFLVTTICSWFVGLCALHILARASGLGTTSVCVAYLAALATTAAFHLRYTRTQREFLVTRRPWTGFAASALVEWSAAAAAAFWAMHRIAQPNFMEVGVLAFGAATAMRYLLRKELLQDVRTPHLRSGGELFIPDAARVRTSISQPAVQTPLAA